MNAYLFSQRGFRGHYDAIEGLYYGAVVVASSWEEANKKAGKHIDFGRRFCGCCGAPPYWSRQDETSTKYASVDEALNASRGGWRRHDFLIVDADLMA